MQEDTLRPNRKERRIQAAKTKRAAPPSCACCHGGHLPEEPAERAGDDVTRAG